MAHTYKNVTISRRVDTPLEWTAIENFFDACFGKGKHDLPKFPKILGSISGGWQEKNRSVHKALNLNEIKSSYEEKKTYNIEFSSLGLEQPPEELSFVYRPGVGDAKLTIKTGDQKTIDKLVLLFTELFPLPLGCVFISYATPELQLAEFLKKFLEERLSGIPIFVAKRDIKAGNNPYKEMIEKSLLSATIVLSICSKLSKEIPWLWWETATVWARQGLVIPLFVNISPEEFNGPISLLIQGKQLFEKNDFQEAMKEVIKKLMPSSTYIEMTQNEEREYGNLRLESKSIYKRFREYLISYGSYVKRLPRIC